MDSGCAVPTLKPGLRETVAAKLLTTASGRCGDAAGAALATSGAVLAVGTAEVEFILVRSALFLAAERAGMSSAARTAMMTITTSSSIRVNAQHRIFITHLTVSLHASHRA